MAPLALTTDYADSRADLLERARAAGASIIGFDHPVTGPSGEVLACDVAWCGPADAARVVVVVSGTHGVEGFAGSALQRTWLRDGESARPDHVAVCLVHALNPYGFRLGAAGERGQRRPQPQLRRRRRWRPWPSRRRSPAWRSSAVAADLDALGAAVRASFADDPVQQWVFAPADPFDDARTRFLRFFVDAYFPAGHVYVEAGSGGTAGGALWASPDRDVLDTGRIERLLQMMDELLGEEAMPRLTELARTGTYRPREPHFYLGVLGVDPSRQGEGLGAVLVEPVLEACDRGGFLAHLESSNPRNVGFYERLGFVAVDDFRCGGPSGPLMTIMTRRPG